MFKQGIRNRLIASFLILIVLTLSVLGSYILWFFHNYNVERLSENLRGDATITGQLLHPYMNGPMEKTTLDTVIKELATKVDLRITVIDTAGIVLADSWENPALMEIHLARPEVAAALAGKTGQTTRYSSTLAENMLYIAIPMKHDTEIVGALRVSTTLAYVEAGFNEMRNVLLLAFLATSLLAVLLSLRLARRYTAPLEELTEVARQIGDGHLDSRVYFRTGDELEILGHTLNNLASRLDDKLSEITAEKRKLELIFEHMDNAVILFDRYGQVLDANKQAALLLGISPAIYGQHNMQVLGTSLLDTALRNTLEQGQSQRIDLRLNIEGIKKVFEVFLATTENINNGAAGVLTVFHDITALKEIEERQADFVANASHELGTPLTAIKGFAETLLDGALQDHQVSTKFVTIIHDEAERMNRLVKDLLQLARISSTEYGQHIKLEPTSLTVVTKAVLAQLNPPLVAKSLTVKIEVSPPELTVRANYDLLNQVLSNLIDNSIKFTLPGGTLLIKCWQENHRALIMVQDSGIGIPAQDLPFIFDRFYRVDRARTRTAGGTGLGLAIVKFLVEIMNGKIEVKSKPDIGTTFIITLSMAED